jgi:methyl halide transferase
MSEIFNLGLQYVTKTIVSNTSLLNEVFTSVSSSKSDVFIKSINVQKPTIKQSFRCRQQKRQMMPAEHWDSLYKSGKTRWDWGHEHPFFKKLLINREINVPVGKLVALGCGLGHDAAFFGQQGFDALGIDYSVEAIKQADKLNGRWATFQKADIFQLPSNLQSKFDYVLEKSCFCIIPPNRQKDYVQVVLKLLKSQGTFIGIFVKEPQNSGIFSTSKERIRELFEPFFNIEFMQEEIKNEKTDEVIWLCVFRRKNSSLI